MKKLILATTLLIAMLLPANLQAKKVAYRGFVDVVGGYWVPNIGVSTTHGVQCSSKYFIGVGGQFDWSAYDDADVGGAVFLTNRFDFTSNKRWNFFINLDTGMHLSAWDPSVVAPWISLTPGIRYAITDKIGLNFGVVAALSGYIEYYYCEMTLVPFIGARIGIDF